MATSKNTRSTRSGKSRAWLRSIAFLTGMGILAGAAHVTIVHGGGYGEAQAVLTVAIAAGVAVGALAIGGTSGRPAITAWLVMAILAGEAFGFLSTAERIVIHREAQAAPLHGQAEAYAKANARVKAAEAAKRAADQAVIDKSAEKGCQANCRQLLQGQATAAAGDLTKARAAADAIKAPASATPLADRLGLPAWGLDLLTAALGSLAANGLACGLIAFAGHKPVSPQPKPAEVPQPKPVEATPPKASTPSPKRKPRTPRGKPAKPFLRLVAANDR